jgi:hypothetical protein
MSRDRVHFTIPAMLLLKTPIRECIEETLGINTGKLYKMGRADEALHIVCRPSQFARFVILRSVKYKEPNNMAGLNMRLVAPPKEETAIDVSKNPNTAGDSGVAL